MHIDIYHDRRDDVGLIYANSDLAWSHSRAEADGLGIQFNDERGKKVAYVTLTWEEIRRASEIARMEKKDV